MNVCAVNSNQLYSFLKRILPLYSFQLYMHILTEPYLSLFASLPSYVKESSSISLDGEKDKINNYAVQKLYSAGYCSIWYVRRLHSKVIVIGSRPDYIVVGTSNLSSRSFTNYELILIIEKPSKTLFSSIETILIEPAKNNRYRPGVIK